MAALSGRLAPWRLLRGSPRAPRTAAGCRPSPCSPTVRNRTAPQPYGYKLSNDPLIIEKVHDIVGLYLHPPDKAVVLCVDEKTQIQAMGRTQPLLPMGLGYVEGVTHGYIRHGTTTLLAALDVATGAVIYECKARHRHKKFLSFLRRMDKEVPPDLDDHLFVDNYCTHKHAKVNSWLAQRPRFHVFLAPTSHHPESDPARQELIAKIEHFITQYNKGSTTFSWTATADSILEKLQRLCS